MEIFIYAISLHIIKWFSMVAKNIPRVKTIIFPIPYGFLGIIDGIYVKEIWETDQNVRYNSQSQENSSNDTFWMYYILVQ